MKTKIQTYKKGFLAIVTGRAYESLAHDVAKHLNISVFPTKIYDFANGEIYVQYKNSVRGSDVFVFQSHTSPINKWIMEQLIMIDALKRASAHRVTVVVPSFPYARQDKKHKGREPISARLMCDLFKVAGADRIMTVDLHASQTQGFFDGPVDHIDAMGILVKYVKNKYGIKDIAVVSPDAGRIKVAEQWSSMLDNCPLAFVHKMRDRNSPNKTKTGRVVGDVTGKNCVIVDDMIDTAGTIAGAVDALKKAGAKSVIIAATHGLLSKPAVERLAEADVLEVVCTNTLPIPSEKRIDKLTVLSIAPLLADVIRAVFEGTSVGEVLREKESMEIKEG
jgi:ribose-phosphate pyrophosphokinase